MHPVAYRAHIGELYYMSVTSGYGCVDIRRFYVPYRLASEIVCSTRSGIGLCLDKWAHQLELLPTIHAVSYTHLTLPTILRV